MGFANKLKKFVTGKTEEELEEEKKEAEKEQAEEEEEEKYGGESCALCGEGGVEKKWAGQYWHKNCARRMRKQSRKMI